MLENGKYYIELNEADDSGRAYGYVLSDDFFTELPQNEIEGGCLEVDVNVRRVAEVYHINFNIRGSVKVECDRCLDLVELPVDVNEDVDVIFSDDDDTEEDNTIVLPEGEQGIDLAWQIYEFAVLALPTKRVHKDGECNPQMQNLLDKYETGDGDDDKTDPRWDILKNLGKDKND